MVFVLQQWSAPKTLFGLLEDIEVRESIGWKYATDVAIKTISNWTIADMRKAFGLPLDDELASLGLSEVGLQKHIGAMRNALDLFKEGLALRRQDQSILVVAYNKVKHGLVALSAVENSEIGVSVIVPSTKGDPKGLLKVGWVPCDDADLAKVVDSTALVSEALMAILHVLYISRFDKDWVIPKWPFRPVSS